MVIDFQAGHRLPYGIIPKEREGGKQHDAAGRPWSVLIGLDLLIEFVVLSAGNGSSLGDQRELWYSAQ